MSLQELIEQARSELHLMIAEHGTKDEKVVVKSQELDLLINQYLTWRAA